MFLKFYILCFAAVFFCVNAADEGPLVKAEDSWQLRTESETGSCHRYGEKVDKAYTEMLSLAKTAYEKMEKYKDNEQTRVMLAELFGIRFDGVNLRSNSQGDFKFVLETFDRIQRYPQNPSLDGDERKVEGEHTAPPGKAFLYCDDSWLAWTEFSIKDDGTPSEVSLAKQLPWGFGKYNGGYYARHRKSYQMRTMRYTPNENGNNACSLEGTIAFTLHLKLRSITLCPKIWGYSKYIPSITSKPVSAGDHLEDFRSPSGAWLHEMTHLVREIKDDAFGFTDIDDQNLWKPKNLADPNSEYEEDKEEKTYGFQRSVWLAKAKSGIRNLAIRNSDNYKFFAMAMTLEGWKWETGYAVRDQDGNVKPSPPGSLPDPDVPFTVGTPP